MHFRFGHISIIQYLSASFNNHIFLESGILIPGALIFSFTIMFLIEYLLKEKNKFLLLIIFIFASFILFRMNRYSSFGNDAPSHFFFIYLIILAIDWKNNASNYENYLNKIILVSIFIFFNKITMLLSLFIPLYFIFNKKFLNLLNNKIFYSLIIIFFIWLGKMYLFQDV